MQATILESCNRSPSCQDYFKNPPLPPPQVASLPGSGTYTPQSWAQELLRRGGWPQTASNLAAIEAWEAAEGGHWKNNDSFNPLNTTQPESGSRCADSNCDRAYPNWDAGFQGTLDTLKYSAYSSIVQQLRQGNDYSALINAIVASPWASSHYGGRLG